MHVVPPCVSPITAGARSTLQWDEIWLSYVGPQASPPCGNNRVACALFGGQPSESRSLYASDDCKTSVNGLPSETRGTIRGPTLEKIAIVIVLVKSKETRQSRSVSAKRRELWSHNLLPNRRLGLMLKIGLNYATNLPYNSIRVTKPLTFPKTDRTVHLRRHLQEKIDGFQMAVGANGPWTPICPQIQRKCNGARNR